MPHAMKTFEPACPPGAHQAVVGPLTDVDKTTVKFLDAGEHKAQLTFFGPDWKGVVKAYSNWSPGARVGALYKALGLLDAAVASGAFDENLVQGAQVTVMITHTPEGYCRIAGFAPPGEPLGREVLSQLYRDASTALSDKANASSPPISPSPTQAPLMEPTDQQCPICALSFDGMNVNDIVTHALGHQAKGH